MIYEMVPPARYPLYGALVSASAAIGSLTGPLIGGGLSEHSSWRWVFLIKYVLSRAMILCTSKASCSAPASAFALFLLLLAMPSAFPYSDIAASRAMLRPSKVAQLDLVGSTLLLAGTYTLITVVLGAGTTFGWDSATTMALFVVSGVSWMLFLCNEYAATRYDWSVQPLFPWRFLQNRAWIGALL